MKQYSQFGSYEWFGLFTVPGVDLEFPGRLTYSAEAGIELEFMCAINADTPPVTHIFGALQTGETCTLFGYFDLDKAGWFEGKISFKKGKIGFLSIVFDTYESDDIEFNGFWTDFTNFQEFCHPQGYKHFAPHKEEPITSFSEGGISIEIGTNAMLRDIGRDIDSIISTKNDDAKKILEDAFAEIHKNYPNKVKIVDDISWSLSFTSDLKINVFDMVARMSKLEHMLSMLLYYPVRVKSAYAKIRSQNNPDKFYQKCMLISMFDMSTHRIRILNKNLNNYLLPIRLSNIDFTSVIANWESCYQDFALFVTRISNKFGKYHEYEIMGEVVISLTQIEKIYENLGVKGHGNRYELVIDSVDCGVIRKSLQYILFGEKSGDIGHTLCNFRGIAAHPPRKNQKPKKYAGDIQLYISRCLEVVIISHIYKRLGISTEIINEFQKKNLQHIADMAYNAPTSTDTTVSANEPKAG